MAYVSRLEEPLLRLSPSDNWVVSDAQRGCFVMAASGGGKTTGPGRAISQAYLRANWGGVITAVKPTEVSLWRDRYIPDNHRSASLYVFDETQGFNFLDHELLQRGMDGIGAVVEYILRIIEAGRRASATASNKGEEAFWQDSTRMLLRYSLGVLYAAQGSLSVGDIICFLEDAPKSLEQTRDPEWQKNSFMFQVLWTAANRPKVEMDPLALRTAVDYWAKSFAATPDKTRGNQVVSVVATLDRLRHGRLKKTFCGRTTIVPEMTFHGALILLAMPTLTWFDDGVIGQAIFRYAWQRAVLGRNSLAEKHRTRPVFLWSDEAQETVSSYDGEFLALCRESKCSVTYLTQSLPTLISKMGGDNPRDAALGLCGKFGTHIYLSNSCPESNEYASRVIGKRLVRRANYSRGNSESVNVGMNAGENESRGSSSNQGGSSGSSHGAGSNSNNYGSNYGSGTNQGTGRNWGSNRGRGVSENESHGFTETMEPVIEPGDFASAFKCGGQANNYEVTGMWFQAGRRFQATRDNYLVELFKQ